MKRIRVTDGKVIRSIRDPIASDGGLVILRGNLAPRGAIIKQSAVPPEMMRYEGPARVFSNEEEACEALTRKDISPGDVVVIRSLGPRGAAGMNFIQHFLWLLSGLKLDESIAVITDGRLSGCNKGCAVAHITPEADERGPLAVVKNGDTIEIDVPKRELNLRIPSDEFDQRIRKWTPRKRAVKKGVLSIYAKMAHGADKGAGLDYSIR